MNLPIQYKRLTTKEVSIGSLLLGNHHPIRLQTMTTTDTMNTIATVEQSIRCIDAGAELIRITAPSKKEAENLLQIKNQLKARGYNTPIVADIHFTPNAAEIAARIVEKVRINPGNYVDKKKFELIEYSDADYEEEIERIGQRFTPLVKICKEYGTALRIGTNHGSLSDRIMSRYGDTPMGMVESAMEFLRVARYENFHNIVLSMKSSNPQVMVQAYRLLVQKMWEEFAEYYPFHLGVTEAGDGEDGRVKSAAGIGTLLEDGIGDTIRVSLTEDPEFEISVCKDLVARYSNIDNNLAQKSIINTNFYNPFEYKKYTSFEVNNIGGKNVPVVIADFSKLTQITTTSLQSIGYNYNPTTDKWNIGDAAADYVFTGTLPIDFALPGTLKIINYASDILDKNSTIQFPIFGIDDFVVATNINSFVNFVMVDCFSNNNTSNDLQLLLQSNNFIANKNTVVLCLSSTNSNAMQSIRQMFIDLQTQKIYNPVVIIVDSNWQTIDQHLIHYSTEAGALLLDGFGDGICLGMSSEAYNKEASSNASGRNYSNNLTTEQFINSTAFSILQATRTRISKTEYISCPSCGRTLFELQETTAKIRNRTNHLKGLKIAIMGCIVNGPGEMADADFGYVGSGIGKITLYKGKEVVRKNIDSHIAVDELINLLKENNVWIEPAEL
jgi:(E)-4-hydroxy-3-methylbut-2-enyl-diphosphate synthase